MKKRWAALTVLIALVTGVAASMLYVSAARAPLRIMLSCMLLSEGEKAGYLDRRKRSALIDALATSASLDAADRTYVPLLKSMCPI
jgi:hypothetical protein